MIVLSEFLFDLIFRQRFALIPDIGTFQICAKSSIIDFSKNVIEAPSYELDFLDFEFKNEGLSFLDFLIQEKNMDSYEASIKIKAFVTQIQQNLINQSYCYIPKIGVLKSAESGKVTFQPAEDLDFFLKNKGNSDIVLSPIPRKFIKNDIEQPVVQQTFVDHTSKYVSSQRNKWVLPVLLIFFALGVLLILIFVYNNNYNFVRSDNENLAKNKNQLEQDSLLFKDYPNAHNLDSTNKIKTNISVTARGNVETRNPILSKKSIDSSTNTQSIKKNSLQTDSNETDFVIENNNQKCAIIVGVMSNQKNVSKLERKIVNMGFQSFKIKANKLTKIGASCECDPKSINSTLQEMKKINADAWVFEP